MASRNLRSISAVFALLMLGAARAQDKFDGLQRDRTIQILHDVAGTVRKNYYDPQYHGVDMEAQFKAAEGKIRNAPHLGNALAAIVDALNALHDSHTYFVPPLRPLHSEYGYRQEMVGERCFITAVRPGTEAAGKLKPGDEVLTIENYRPTRQNLDKINYVFNRLFPGSAVHLVIRNLDGAQQTLEIVPKTRDEKTVWNFSAGAIDYDPDRLVRESQKMAHLFRERYYEYGDALMIWKMPEFFMDDEAVDRMFGRARKHQAVILDLRGNPGGRVRTLERVVANAFDHDITIAKRVGRKNDLKPQFAKTFGSSAFTGKLFVLIDSHSASAAELFARVVQLEHRGVVLGDRSSGSVMESEYFPLKLGTDALIVYGASITHADLIMADGKSLEHNGVVPDETVLPTAAI